MHLTHLGLPVRDVPRSRRFYETYFAFDPATAQQYDDGTVVIRNADGFDLALHGGQDVGPLPPFLHFGFRLANPDEVRALLPDACGRSAHRRAFRRTCLRGVQVRGPGRPSGRYWEPREPRP
ncbi:VOC family protein [Streptomyces sp. NPDC002845]